MTTPARWPRSDESPLAGEWRERAGKGLRSSSAPIAMVVQRREYPAADVLESLVRAGFHVIERQWAGTVDLAVQLQPALIVAAVSPSRAADLEVIRELSQACEAFVLLLADGREGFAAGLKAGASACLSDDDGREAFEAQVASVLRRESLAGEAAEQAPANTFVAGPLVVDASAHRVEYHGQAVYLSRMEFAILLYLARHPRSMCSAEDIVTATLGPPNEIAASARLRSHILRIRRQLRAIAPNEEIITNVRGIGYRLDTG